MWIINKWICNIKNPQSLLRFYYLAPLDDLPLELVEFHHNCHVFITLTPLPGHIYARFSRNSITFASDYTEEVPPQHCMYIDVCSKLKYMTIVFTSFLLINGRCIS